ncbi:MAG: DNA gyrase/topoisomerase IV subunit A, partial [Bacteroidales bacterium]
SFISDSPGSYLLDICDDKYPQAEVVFGGKHSKRGSEIIDIDTFIAGKSIRAKGKRVTAFEVESVKFTEPLQKEEETDNIENIEEEVRTESESDSPTLF